MNDMKVDFKPKDNKATPDTILHLRDEMGRLYPQIFNVKEEKTGKMALVESIIDKYLIVENIFIFFGVLFFCITMLVYTTSFGKSGDINLINYALAAATAAASYWAKVKNKKNKDQNSLSLADQITERQFDREKFKKDHELKIKQIDNEYNLNLSKIDFFTKELVGLIASIDKDRLESINLAMTALIYDKEGVVQKEMKELKSLLSRKIAEEDYMFGRFKDMKDSQDKHQEDKKLTFEEKLDDFGKKINGIEESLSMFVSSLMKTVDELKEKKIGERDLNKSVIEEKTIVDESIDKD